MDSKRFIFVFLLMFCLYSSGKSAAIQKRLSYELRGNNKCWHAENDLQAQILSAEWLPGWQLNVTVQSPTHDDVCNFATTGIGHFTFDDKNGHWHKFLGDAEFVNGYNIDRVSGDCHSYVGQNPYSYVIGYDSKDAPPQGANVEIALSIYYECAGDYSNYVDCTSCDVTFNSVFH